MKCPVCEGKLNVLDVVYREDEELDDSCCDKHIREVLAILKSKLKLMEG